MSAPLFITNFLRRFASRLTGNIRDAVLSLRTSDHWVLLFLALGCLAWGVILLWPGHTLDAYHVYVWVDAVPDAALAAPMIAIGLWALLARSARQRRRVALVMCFAWSTLAAVIALGNYHYLALTPEAGPSGANIHYIGWAILAFLTAYRAAARGYASAQASTSPTGYGPQNDATSDA